MQLNIDALAEMEQVSDGRTVSPATDDSRRMTLETSSNLYAQRRSRW